MTARPIHARLLGHDFRFFAHEGLFSADRVDDGTRLLLDHLPDRAPENVLDLGCGYGALGLPIAAAHPEARCTLVDRDLLAVEYSHRNAAIHGLSNVTAQGSLGYRDLGDARYDWALCNVPARIGEAAIEYILGGGASRLTAHGELRVVVIRDLGPVVERVCERHGWRLVAKVEGARHIVYALGPEAFEATDHESLYRLDSLRIGDFSYDRPHDVNEDLPHLREGVPLLLECLPRSPARAVTWRGGYGPVPCTLARRGAHVIAADRDLLALAYVLRNGAGLTIETRGSPDFPSDLRTPLLVGELYANVGLEGLARLVEGSRASLERNGQALWLGLAKTVKALDATWKKAGATTVASRGAWSVVRVPALKAP